MHKTINTHDSWLSNSIAHERSKCIERVLDDVGRNIADKHGRTPAVERRDVMQTARNTYEVEYLLRGCRNRQLSLRFILTGEKADLVLVQTRETPEQAKLKKDDPGEIDQHVYRLEEMDRLKGVVEKKIVSHLLS